MAVEPFDIVSNVAGYISLAPLHADCQVDFEPDGLIAQVTWDDGETLWVVMASRLVSLKKTVVFADSSSDASADTKRMFEFADSSLHNAALEISDHIHNTMGAESIHQRLDRKDTEGGA